MWLLFSLCLFHKALWLIDVKKHAFSILRLEVLQKIVLKILWQYYMEICRTRYNILLVEIFLALHEIEKSIQGAMMGVLLIINLVPMYLTNLCIQMV